MAAPPSSRYSTRWLRRRSRSGSRRSPPLSAAQPAPSVGQPCHLARAQGKMALGSPRGRGARGPARSPFSEPTALLTWPALAVKVNQLRRSVESSGGMQTMKDCCQMGYARDDAHATDWEGTPCDCGARVNGTDRRRMVAEERGLCIGTLLIGKNKIHRGWPVQDRCMVYFCQSNMHLDAMSTYAPPSPTRSCVRASD